MKPLSLIFWLSLSMFLAFWAQFFFTEMWQSAIASAVVFIVTMSLGSVITLTSPKLKLSGDEHHHRPSFS